MFNILYYKTAKHNESKASSSNDDKIINDIDRKISRKIADRNVKRSITTKLTKITLCDYCVENITIVRHNINEKFVNDKHGSEGYTTQGAKFIVSVYYSKLYV